MRVPLTMELGPKYANTQVGYRILNLDRTDYSPFSVVDVVETSPGNFAVKNGIQAPEEGGYVIAMAADGVTEIREAPVEVAPLLYAQQPLAPIPKDLPGVDFFFVRGDTFIRQFNVLDILPTDTVAFTLKNASEANCWWAIEDFEGTLMVLSYTAARPGLNVLNGVDVHNTLYSEASVIADVDKVSLRIEAGIAKQIAPGVYTYDWQRQRGSDTHTMGSGIMRVVADVTREIYGNA